MRGKTRYAGAMLLYGPQRQPPDLTLAMQFLMDDLRFEGRKVTWIALKGSSLRLRVEGYELVLAHTSEPLPPQAFQGVYRPRENRAEDAHQADDRTDLARGRVLHALRQHQYALSVLLRPRGTPACEDPDAALLVLVRECRAMIEPVIEAAPPSAVLWQPGAIAFTCEEFLASRAELLLLPGNHATPLQFDAAAEKPRYRPALAFPDPAAIRKTDVIATDTASDMVPENPTEASTATQKDAAVHLPVVFGRRPPRVGSTPQSRNDRVARRSAGQLFSSTDRASARPVALPRLHRQDARLVQALRDGEPPEIGKPAIGRRRRINLARAANCAALILWYAVLLQPLSNWM